MNIDIIWTWKVDLDPSLLTERGDLIIQNALSEKKGSASGPLPAITRSQLKRLIEEGHVTADGVVLKAKTKLKFGTLIQILIPPPQPTDLVPEDRPLEILFEDEYLLVVNKPPGLTVHPSATQKEGTLVHALIHHIKDLSGIGGVLRPGIVHRIDKDTSGALVITKTDAVHVKLAEVFSKHDIDRCYWALCYGAPSTANKATKIESLIGRSPSRNSKDRKKMSMHVKEGRKAISHYKVLKEFSLPSKKPFASWLEVTLETGRTHQIRVHLTGIGHSILGDPVYGTPTENQPKWQALPKSIRDATSLLPGQALHARVLGFVHPMTQEKLRFEAEPPPGFMRVLNELTAYS